MVNYRVASVERSALDQNDLGRALQRSWFPVARSVDVETPTPATLLGVDLVAFRDDRGTARVAANTCPHRGGSLAMGTVVGGAIQCPYHGWRWHGESGRCLSVPSHGSDGVAAAEARLRTYLAREEHGLIWTTLSDAPLGDPTDFDELCGIEWDSDWVGDPPLDVSMNVCAAVENFRDVAHFPFVHEKTMGVLPHEVPPLDTRREGFHAYMERRGQAGEDQTMDARWAELQPDEVVIAYHAIAPTSVMLTTKTAIGNRVLLFAVAPTAVDESRWYMTERLAANFPIALDVTMALNRAITEEDLAVLEHVRPRGFQSLDHQVHCLADKFTLTYRAAFMAFVEEAIG